MDKYEYRIKAEQIRKLAEQEDFASAMKIANTIDWNRVRSIPMLCLVGEIYEKNNMLEESRDVMLIAYDRHPYGRMIIYSLAELSIRLEDYIDAVEYYKEFVQVAPRDTGRYILQYKLYEAQHVGIQERIAVLEEFKRHEYIEKWAFELAYLYHRAGMKEKCVAECDELILWFADGKYVEKAMELKMIYAPLTEEQQKKYDSRNDVEIEKSIAAVEAVAEKPKEEEPDIQVKTLNYGIYDTVNLQQELARSMQQILDVTQQEPKQVNNESISTESKVESTSKPDLHKKTEETHIEHDTESEQVLSEAAKALEQITGVPQTEAAQEDKVEPESVASEQTDLGKTKIFDINAAPTKIIPVKEINQQLQEQSLQQEAEIYPEEEVSERVAPETVSEETTETPEIEISDALKEQLEEIREEVEEQPEEIAEEVEEQPEEIAEEVEEQPEEVAEEVEEQPEEETAEMEAASREMEETASQSEKEMLEKQATCQMNIEEVLKEWERIKAATSEDGDDEQDNMEEETMFETVTEELTEDVDSVDMEEELPLITEGIELESVDEEEELYYEEVEETEAAEEAQEEYYEELEEAEEPEEVEAEETEKVQEEYDEEPEKVEEAEETEKVQEEYYEESEEAKEPQEEYYEEPEEVEEPEETEEVQEEYYEETPVVPVQPEIIEKTMDFETISEEPEEEELSTIQYEEEAPEEEYEVEEEDNFDFEFGHLEDAIMREAEAALQAMGQQTSPATDAPVQEEPEELEEEPQVEEKAEEEYQTTEESEENEDYSYWSGKYQDEPESEEDASEQEEPEEFELELEESEEEGSEYETVTEEDYEAYREAERVYEQPIYRDMPEESETAEESVEENYEEPEVAYEATEEAEEDGSYEESEESYEEPQAAYEESEKVEEETYEAPEATYEELEESEEETYEAPEAAYEESEESEEESYEASEAAYEESEEVEAEESYEDPEAAYEESEEVEEVGSYEAPEATYEATEEPAEESVQEPVAEAASEEAEQQQPEPEVPTEDGSLVREEIDTEDDGEQIKLGAHEESFKKIFKYFTEIPGVSEQIIDCIGMIGEEPTTGNMIIMGDTATGKTTLAAEMIKLAKKCRKITVNKVARITGEAMNEKDVADIINSSIQGILIIEEAASMTADTVRELDRILEETEEKLLVILEDSRERMMLLLEMNLSFREKFPAVIDLPPYTNTDLVAFATTYATEKGCTIDEMGILALYSKLAEMQFETDFVPTFYHVKEIIDQAMEKAQKKKVKSTFGRFLSKKKEKDQGIVIREKDFM